MDFETFKQKVKEVLQAGIYPLDDGPDIYQLKKSMPCSRATITCSSTSSQLANLIGTNPAG